MAQLPNGFFTQGKKIINDEIEELVVKYRKYIYYLIMAKGFRNSEKDDCFQYVVVALAKSYKNRFKYKDWHGLVKTICDRRVTDFSKHMNTFNSHISTEADLSGKSEEPEEFCYHEALSNGKCDTKYEVSDVFAGMVKVVKGRHKSVFTEWEIAFTEKLASYSREGVFNIKTILSDDELVELGSPYLCESLFSKYKEKLSELNIGKVLGI